MRPGNARYRAYVADPKLCDLIPATTFILLTTLRSRGNRFWGFKDPRTLLTLPFWMEAVTPKFFGSFRHPLRLTGLLLPTATRRCWRRSEALDSL
jgi:hypothetical protein